jgi:hypothetical protein
MSSVIDIRAYVNPSVIQTLVMVDLQQEYIASPRVLALEGTTSALANCRAALTHARAMGLPIAFVRWIDRTPLFNKASPFSRWIEGFEPHGVDMVFERNRPSCYASRTRRSHERGRREFRARRTCRRGGVPLLRPPRSMSSRRAIPDIPHRRPASHALDEDHGE